MNNKTGGRMKGRRVQIKFNTGTRFHKSKRSLLDKQRNNELRQFNKKYKE